MAFNRLVKLAYNINSMLLNNCKYFRNSNHIKEGMKSESVNISYFYIIFIDLITNDPF